MPIKISIGIKPLLPNQKPDAVQLYCGGCGSTNVGAECCTYWSPEEQKWEAGDPYDDRTCHDCGVEGKDILKEMLLSEWEALGEPYIIPGIGE